MRTLILCCVVAVLALGSWLLFGNAPDVTPPSSPPQVEPASAPPPVTAAPEASPPEVVAREAVTTREATDNEAPPMPDDATWLELTVVDAITQQPAPGVDVWWTNETQRDLVKAMPRRERDALFSDRDVLATRFGWHALTDSNGKIRVTPGANGASVMARDATRFATGDFSDKKPTPEGGHRLELQRELVLRVHVVDATGKDAAGVPLQIAQFDPESPQPPRFLSHEREITDAHGAASFRHVQKHRKWTWGPRQGQAVAAMAVSIATLAKTAHETTTVLPFDELPADPVELRLPATGHLELRFTFAGEPMPSLKQVMLHEAGKDDAETNNSAWRAPVEDDGTARFVHVPLGMQFAAGDFQWKVDVAGPTQPGERVRHVVELTDRLYVLTGRMLLPDGAPAAALGVTLRFSLGRGQEQLRGGGSRYLETAADGRFFQLLFGPQEEGVEWQLGDVRFEAQHEQHGAMHATVEPRTVAVGANDLGDVRLGGSPLFASGQIAFDCERRNALQPIVERLRPMQIPGREGIWEETKELKVVVSGDRFDVRGEAPEGRYRLAVRTYHHLPVAPIEFQPGQQDLRIEVHCGNQPEITCLLPDKVPPGALRVIMVQRDVQKAPDDPFDIASRILDPSLGEYTGRAAGESGAHRFTWRALPDGRYTLRFFGAPQAPLLEIPDVVLPLPDGGDARLVDIDLRQLVTPLHVTVKIDETFTDRAGRGVMVFALPQPADADWYGIKALNGECVLAAPRGPIDLLVKEDASMPTTLSGVQDEAEVTIRPWPSVEVTFAGIDALPEGAQLSANARMEDPAVRNRDRRRYHVDGSSGMVENLYRANRDSGRVEDGKITLQLIDNVTPLHVSLRFGRHSKQLTQFSPNQLVAGQPVTVQLSIEELQQVVAELQAQGDGK
ncbi:MAG: hypothetical protein R3F29_14050 [Planctomycetota bacterium]